jgi:hypothetical protein
MVSFVPAVTLVTSVVLVSLDLGYDALSVRNEDLERRRRSLKKGMLVVIAEQWIVRREAGANEAGMAQRSDFIKGASTSLGWAWRADDRSGHAIEPS